MLFKLVCLLATFLHCADANGSYKYYKFEVNDWESGTWGTQVAEFNLYDADGFVPIEACYGTKYPDHQRHWCPTIHDGNFNLKWASHIKDGFVVFTFSSPIAATEYEFYTGNDDHGRDPTAWTVYGSNDETEWDVLDKHSDVTPPKYRRYTYGRLPLTPPAPADELFYDCQQSELLLILDASGSISYDNFTLALDLFKATIRPNDQEEADTCWREACFGDSIRVGALTYADNTAYQMPIESRTLQETLRALGRIKYKPTADIITTEYSRTARAPAAYLADRPLGRYTQIDSAFKHAKTILEEVSTDTNQIVLFMSDGFPRYWGDNGAGSDETQILLDEAVTASKALRDNKVVTLAVGIDDFSLGNLQDLAGNPSNAMEAGSYNFLQPLQQDLANSLTSHFCSPDFGKPIPVPQQCTPTEILLVVDASSSIGAGSFGETTDFFQKVFELGEGVLSPCWRAECFGLGGISVGALTYADYAAYQIPFGTRSFEGVHSSLQEMKYKNVTDILSNHSRPARGDAAYLAGRPLGQYTQADSALKYARDILATQRANRIRSNRQVLVLISDGLPRYRHPDAPVSTEIENLFDETLAEAELLREEDGVMTLGMVVGPSANAGNLQQLVGGDATNTFTADGFEAATAAGMEQHVADAVADKICSGGKIMVATEFGGPCEQAGTGADCWYVENEDACNELAAEKGLPDTEAGVTTFYARPPGCYYNPESTAGSQLWFNRAPVTNVNCNLDNRCLCQCREGYVPPTEPDFQWETAGAVQAGSSAVALALTSVLLL